MNLGFTTKIGDEPNYFIWKIWIGFDHLDTVNHSVEFVRYNIRHLQKLRTSFDFRYEPVKAKIHTIREDKNNRWKVGRLIHFVINNRTKNRFQFAPVIPVTCIQQIIIDYSISDSKYPWICIDGKYHTPANNFEYFVQLDTLAKNDGFYTLEDFLKYFDKDFEGKIIHWTNFKY